MTELPASEGFDPHRIRADVVGSLLRPPWLLEARAAHARGELDDAGLARVEDRAVDAAVAMQAEAGVDVVTDGEMRRLSFQSQLPAAVSGFGDWDLDAFLWGRWHGDRDVGDAERAPPRLAVLERLERRRPICTHELRYVLGVADALAGRPVKVTLPSPTLFSSFYDPERAPACYPRLEAFLDDVTEILAREVRELAAMGARYLQIDAPHYTMFLDAEYRAFYARHGVPAERWLDFALGYDNALVRAAPGVHFAFHLCRGNQGSRWLTEGGYAPLAPELFAGIAAERLMLEYDDARSGGFEPLAHVPADKTVVLGLVTTKHGRLESEDALARRVDEAAQRAKLELVARLARRALG